MRETKELAMVLILMFLVGAGAYGVSYFIENTNLYGFSIEQYSAYLSENGTLYENYTYEIYKDYHYHMLYRTWDSPLLYVNESMECVQISKVYLSYAGVKTIPYVKDYHGSVWLLNKSDYNSDYINYIAKKAKNSEAGVYAPDGFPAGHYQVKYVFRIKPTLLYDGKDYFFKFFLAREHYKYWNVDIIFPSKFQVLSEPYMALKSQGKYTVIRGTLEEDFPLRVWLTFKELNGFSHFQVDNVNYNLEKFAQDDNRNESLRYWGAWLSAYLGYYGIFFAPFLYIFMYLLGGRERKTKEIKEYVMVPPRRRPPWIVNFIFKNEGDYLEYKDATIATLLDFRKRGLIDIVDDGKIIKLKGDYVTLEGFEGDLLGVLYDLSENGEIDLEKLKRDIEELKKGRRERIEKISNIEMGVISWAENKKRYWEEFIEYPHHKFIEGMISAGIIAALFNFLFVMAFAQDFAFYFIVAIVFWFLYMFQFALMFYKPDVLGRWRKDYYEEKIEWDSFRRFLHSEEELEEKSRLFPEYIDDWLIYGWALGEGKHVEKVLKKNYEDLDILNIVGGLRNYVVYMIIPVSWSATGVGGGAMGGFGGGGAGAR